MTADAELAARQTLDAYMAAWNAADNDGVRAALNFPHVMLGPAGQVVVAAESSEIHTDFAALREREGWGSSTLDAFEAVDSMATKVHCKVRFSRYRPDGTKYGSGRMLYIVTNQDGHWGIQLRSGMPDADLLRAREGPSHENIASR
jgi:hypothetical protein